MKYIAIVHEKGNLDCKTKYEFDTYEERRDFLKIMSGVLVCTEAYSKNR